jgi:sulfite oxidase
MVNRMTEQSGTRDAAAMQASGARPEQNGLVVIKQQPLNAEAPLTVLSEEITPLENFYVRSNFPVPSLPLDSWRLEVDGLVERPLEISFAELAKLPSRTLTVTMECAGNDRTGFSPLPSGEPWGSGAISTGIWRGVTVRQVLDMAGLRSGVIEILFTGADRGKVEGAAEPVPFARSLPVDKALDPDTLLAYELNGEPLPPEHGAPVRLLVPDWYGMASVKWVEGITALDQPFGGFYQADRYIMDYPGSDTVEPLRNIMVKSLIINPKSGQILPPGKHTIEGVAWSGYGQIKGVEVSVNHGAWQAAQMVGGAKPHTWQRWGYEWNATNPGRYELRVRARDEAGNVQPKVAAWNRLGYANNAIQSIAVEISE